MRSICCAHPWYVIYSAPRKEEYAAQALHTDLGVEVYVPLVHQHGGAPRQLPFFPRYFFIQADLQEISLRRILATPGVGHLLTTDSQPQALPAGLIQAIRAHVDHINATGGLPPHSFQPGDTVRVKGGPLEGLEALFVGFLTARDRVRILLEFLNRPTEVQIALGLLEPIAPARPRLQARRTRGQGRPIHANSPRPTYRE